MNALYYRLYCALFNKTGFNPGEDNDQGFLNPMGILDPVYIGDIPGIEELVISYDSVDINVQYMTKPKMAEKNWKMVGSAAH